jgi:hypothetical protein
MNEPSSRVAAEELTACWLLGGSTKLEAFPAPTVAHVFHKGGWLFLSLRCNLFNIGELCKANSPRLFGKVFILEGSLNEDL